MIEPNPETLWQQYLLKEISQKDCRRLADAMTRDESLRNRLMDDLELHSVIRQLGLNSEEFMLALDQRLRGAGETIRRGESTPYVRDGSRVVSLFIRWAAAAMLLIGAGVFFFVSRARTEPTITVVRRIGTVEASENTFGTGPRSFCQLAFPDKGMVAMDENTTVRIDSITATGGRIVRHDSGRIYLDVTPQPVPMVIHSGDVRVDILGTRLLVGRADQAFAALLGGQPCVRVLDGQARVATGTSVAYPRTGQIALPLRPGDSRDLMIATMASENEAVNWLAALGMDGVRIAQESRQHTQFLADGNVDFDNYIVKNGEWKIGRTSNETWIRQESPQGGGIQFGESKWLKGQLKGKFRFAEPIGRGTYLGIVFFYPDEGLKDVYPIGVGPIGNQLGGWKLDGSWIAFGIAFEIRDNTLIVPSMHISMENHPEATWSFPPGEKWIRSPTNTPLKRRDACGIGLYAKSCALEVRNLRLEDATATESRSADK